MSWRFLSDALNVDSDRQLIALLLKHNFHSFLYHFVFFFSSFIAVFERCASCNYIARSIPSKPQPWLHICCLWLHVAYLKTRIATLLVRVSPPLEQYQRSFLGSTTVICWDTIWDYFPWKRMPKKSLWGKEYRVANLMEAETVFCWVGFNFSKCYSYSHGWTGTSMRWRLS